MRTTLKLSLFLAALTLAAPPASAATILFSNFGPGYTYDLSGNHTNWGILSGEEYDLAGAFNVGSMTATFGGVRLGLTNCGCSTVGDDFEVWLMDAGFNVLETIAYTAPLSGAHGTNVVVTASGLSLLNANTPYFIGISTTGTDSVWWWRNVAGDPGPFALAVNNGAWSTGPTNFAFEVTGTPVPEPTALLLVATGLAAVGWRRRKHRRD